MSFILGIDAGGSRTTAAVATDAGVILARAEAGPGALRPGLTSVAAAAIYSAARDAMQRARVSEPAAVVVIGAAGAAHQAERDALAAALEGSGIGTRLTITTDAEIALEAAFGQQPGIALLAGTGSVAWARFPTARRPAPVDSARCSATAAPATISAAKPCAPRAWTSRWN